MAGHVGWWVVAGWMASGDAAVCQGRDREMDGISSTLSRQFFFSSLYFFLSVSCAFWALARHFGGTKRETEKDRVRERFKFKRRTVKRET